MNQSLSASCWYYIVSWPRDTIFNACLQYFEKQLHEKQGAACAFLTSESDSIWAS